ncbi:chromate transporter [Clostridium sp. CMCC3677]|uniref:chromate transporter n=1 Tax=Clostridium sp. CMCC3677 TaxID=2949963 RepID=UPI0013F0FD9A|nr:chromate transporter [Clostridium sp. CMCC3677]NFG61806.1 chromate transporter [Clostridium botulinum]NFQ10360.1 chromate transporter [Clostridium botulinum]
MNKILEMFISFFKIGAFTFGGGYAMIPLIEEEVVNKKNWLTKEEFMDFLIVSQSLPGALAINCSAFIGQKIGGILGELVAILAVTLPSFFIIILIATFFMQFRDNYFVNLAFKGINAAVPMLVLFGVISLSKGVQKNVRTLIMIIVALIALMAFNIHPVIVILVSAIYGMIFLREQV